MKRAQRIAIIFLIAVIFMFFFLNKIYDNNLTSTISSARNIDGVWKGTVSFTERVPQCSYRGDMELTLQQNGNNVQGGFSVIAKSAQGSGCVRQGSEFRFPITGTVSSSAIDLTISGTDKLLGSFTTNQLTLRWEQCSNCASGPAIKFVGPMFLAK